MQHCTPFTRLHYAAVVLATGVLARVRVIIVILSKDRSSHRTLS